jgi:hypothetical protein
MRRFLENEINQTFLQHATRYGFRRCCLESHFNVRSRRTVLTRKFSLLRCEAAPSFACYTMKMKSIWASETSTIICLSTRHQIPKDFVTKICFSPSNGATARGGPRPLSRVSSILPGLEWIFSNFCTLALLPKTSIPYLAWSSYFHQSGFHSISFRNKIFFRGWRVSPTFNSQPGGPGYLS